MSFSVWTRIIGSAYMVVIMLGAGTKNWPLVIGLGFFGLMWGLANLTAEVAALRRHDDKQPEREPIAEWEKQ